MRKNRFLPVCPKCNLLSLDYVRTDGVSDFYDCRACGWQGADFEMKSHEFWIEEVSYYKISWNVIDRIVYLFYERAAGEDYHVPHYEFIQNGECSNDTSYQFDVEPVIGDYEARDTAKFREDGKPRDLSNSDVLNILCQDGWLEPGRYLVEVCW